jgi:hypothetical protein
MVFPAGLALLVGGLVVAGCGSRKSSNGLTTTVITNYYLAPVTLTDGRMPEITYTSETYTFVHQDTNTGG